VRHARHRSPASPRPHRHRRTRPANPATHWRPTERQLRPGVVLPDRSATPGAIDPRVTQSDLATTICVSGYTATVRPSSSYTDAIKTRQLAGGYALHGDTDRSDYEEDHLIPLELGGSPTSVRNLWPQPYAGRTAATAKDSLENRLHTMVCDGSLPLQVAQQAIARNWWAAYQRFVVAGAVPHRAAPVAPPPAPRHPHRHRHASGGSPLATRHSCTTTSSGSCIEGGEFCPQASYGHVGYDAEGRKYTCTGDTERPHWET
jgi:hypothetical protein